MEVRAVQKAAQVAVTRNCVTCGNEVVGGRADRKFCSSACRQKAYRNRELEPTQQSDIEFLTEIRVALRMMPLALRQRNLGHGASQLVIDEARELIATLTEDQERQRQEGRTTRP